MKILGLSLLLLVAVGGTATFIVNTSGGTPGIVVASPEKSDAPEFLVEDLGDGWFSVQPNNAYGRKYDLNALTAGLKSVGSAEGCTITEIVPLSGSTDTHNASNKGFTERLLVKCN